MATTAAQVTKAILQKILTHGAESELEPVEFQDAVFAMNNYMFAQAAIGVNLGYTEVANLGDTITVAPGAIMGMINNIAIDIASDYGYSVSRETILNAGIGMDAMRKLSRNITPTAHPATLPIGAANEFDHVFNDRHFFPETDENILTETNNNIGLESGT